MPSDFDNRTRSGERRYPNGERMRDEDIRAAEEAEAGPEEIPHTPHNPGRYLPALVLVAVGLIFLLSNMGLFHIYNVWHYWPLILIVSGVVRMSSRDHHAKSSATVMLILGAIFLLSNMGLFYIHNVWHYWPLALIGVGLFLFSKSWGGGNFGRNAGIPNAGRDRWASAPLADSDSWLQNWAFFGGVSRLITSQNFLGGELFAVFGGVEIDLRRAQIANNGRPAVIEANAVFGGISIKVPDNWRIAVRGVGIFGGYQDEAMKIRMADPQAPLLIVSGYAAFGGVVIE